MIQTTRWSPDTCGCTVDYQWDDSVAPSSRVHTITNIVNLCPAHAGQQASILLDENTNIIHGENKRKNKFLERLRSTISTLTTTDTSGNIVLKDGAVSWSLDANRVLQISTSPALTTAQRNAAQSWADTNLGVGKVQVN